MREMAFLSDPWAKDERKGILLLHETGLLCVAFNSLIQKSHIFKIARDSSAPS